MANRHYDVRFLQGIICLDSATQYHNLSTHHSGGVTIYSDNRVPLNSRCLNLELVDTLSYEDTIQIGPNLWVTNAERTIAEMIAGDRYPEYIFQSLEYYIDLHGDAGIEKLRSYAIKYGCLEKFEEYLTDLPTWDWY